MWMPIGTEDYDKALELAVLIDGIAHWSLSPCRRVVGGWVHCDTHLPVRQRPTHWRPAPAGPVWRSRPSEFDAAPDQVSIG